MLLLKIKKKTALADPLGRLIVKYLEHNLDMKHIDIIIPVPLHESRYRQRGFNQAELLSRVVSVHYNVPTVTGILNRVRETLPQFDLPRPDRFKNIRGAFDIMGAPIIKGRNILLIDDIYTTGSTVSECTRVLKTSGAQNVHILTLSRTI
jgi:ComF family protein